jgi:hypothetical protein
MAPPWSRPLAPKRARAVPDGASLYIYSRHSVPSCPPPTTVSIGRTGTVSDLLITQRRLRRRHALRAFVFITCRQILPSIHFGIGSDGLTWADLVDCGSIEVSG